MQIHIRFNLQNTLRKTQLSWTIFDYILTVNMSLIYNLYYNYFQPLKNIYNRCAILTLVNTITFQILALYQISKLKFYTNFQMYVM